MLERTPHVHSLDTIWFCFTCTVCVLNHTQIKLNTERILQLSTTTTHLAKPLTHQHTNTHTTQQYNTRQHSNAIPHTGTHTPLTHSLTHSLTYSTLLRLSTTKCFSQCWTQYNSNNNQQYNQYTTTSISCLFLIFFCFL